jgi:hypothetical protein
VSYRPCLINPSAEPELYGRGSTEGDRVFEYMRSISESEGLSIRYDWSEDGSEVVLSDPGG